MKARQKRWARAERREAFVRCFELAAISAKNTPISQVPKYAALSGEKVVTSGGVDAISSEAKWREWLRRSSNIGPARIDREVRLVRRRAARSKVVPS